MRPTIVVLSMLLVTAQSGSSQTIIIKPEKAMQGMPACFTPPLPKMTEYGLFCMQRGYYFSVSRYNDLWDTQGEEFIKRVNKLLLGEYPSAISELKVFVLGDDRSHSDGHTNISVKWYCRITPATAETADYYFDGIGIVVHGTTSKKAELRADSELQRRPAQVRAGARKIETSWTKGVHFYGGDTKSRYIYRHYLSAKGIFYASPR